MEEALRAAQAAGELEGLHAVLVLKDGAVFAEAYFDGADEAWGRDLGVVAHGPDTLHDLRSVSKSITGLLYGIALEEGIVPGLDAPLYAGFPGHEALLEADPRRAGILVRHALTMTMGTDWDESLPYTDPRNSEIAMVLSPDPLAYVLSRDVIEAPGGRWTYSGGATALLGGLIERGSGMKLPDYAAAKLLEPLGITRWEWAEGPDGTPAAASGLRLTARGLARIGEMILAGGAWDGAQVVPASWLEESFHPHVPLGELSYGLHWYMPAGGGAWVAGFGNGGQRFSVNPGMGLVMVVFAGLYNDFDAWRLPVKVSMEFLGPALEAAAAR
ncbi:serine hydrolase domain-containing protein [Rhodovulum sp. DZ06]|uniref:serine hydrolase domain-containing protein n=1 Tax=Rhodovulum sp. DZ06 TaxID=3425126 RepID=UPI003D34CF08